MTSARLPNVSSVLSPRSHIYQTVDAAARASPYSQPLVHLNDLPTVPALADLPTATPPMAPAAVPAPARQRLERQNGLPASALYP